MVRRFSFVILSRLRWNLSVHSLSMHSWLAYGSPTLEHASLILDGYHLPGIRITRHLSYHHRLRGSQDGAENVKRSSPLGHIIARFVEGDQGSHLLQMPTTDKTLQVYPQDGSSLPMDNQLCLSSNLSSFHSLSILCNSIYDVP